MRSVILALTLGLSLAACVSVPTDNAVQAETVIVDTAATDTATAEAAVLNVLQTQSAAWNRGDIDGFMAGYWNSEQLRFASGGDVTTGWAATNARYKARYKDRAAMGQLTFDRLGTSVLASDAAIVHGRWALDREADRPTGLFTLVFRNFGQGWVIVSDTTTSASTERILLTRL